MFRVLHWLKILLSPIFIYFFNYLSTKNNILTFALFVNFNNILKNDLVIEDISNTLKCLLEFFSAVGTSKCLSSPSFPLTIFVFPLQMWELSSRWLILCSLIANVFSGFSVLTDSVVLFKPLFSSFVINTFFTLWLTLIVTSETFGFCFLLYFCFHSSYSSDCSKNC